MTTRQGEKLSEEAAPGPSQNIPVSPCPQDTQKVRPARPQRVKDRGVPLRYVEGLNDARTPLAGFFSILL